jgi:hypothetical protein
MSNSTRAVAPALETESGQAPAKAEAPAQAAPNDMGIGPGPVDINELSMEVAALRTLYLMNVWPDHNNGSWKHQTNAPWTYILDEARSYNTAEGPRPPGNPRKAADATDAYKRVLSELRIAFIAGQDDRIVDLTDQLEELAEDDSIELDDVVTITENAKRICHQTTTHMTPECVVNYLNSYGKDFPAPINMLGSAFIDRNPGAPIAAASKAFLLKELTWQLCGYPLYPNKNQKGMTDAERKKVVEKIAEIDGKERKKKEDVEKRIGGLIDKASNMSADDCKKEWAINGSLRKEYDAIKREVFPGEVLDNFVLLRHLLQQDMAELLSNSRLVPAIEARVAYLNKAGFPAGKNK